MFGNNVYQYNPQMMLQQQQRLGMLEQQYPQFSQPQPQYTQPNTQQFMPQTPVQTVGLQGKSVDSIEVVKATDIPLDGSISYFPITDGSAIVTKQLQMDGTSKTVIYRPVTLDDTKQEQPKYVTIDDVREMLKQEPKDMKDVKEEIKSIKRQLRDLTDDLKDYKRKGDN